MDMALPEVVSRDHWLAARKAFLVKEKDFTRQRDALNAERRRLPMVRIDKEYVFEGPDGRATLLDLFEGRRQLIVGHFMFDPTWDDGCPSCSAGAMEMSEGLLEHLRVRDTYSVFARGAESIGGSYYMLDETALGRQEEWEEPKGRSADARGSQPDFAS
jgi:predicted dithiol-disulfide oxidoreductase (DUF899 family)